MQNVQQVVRAAHDARMTLRLEKAGRTSHLALHKKGIGINIGVEELEVYTMPI